MPPLFTGLSVGVGSFTDVITGSATQNVTGTANPVYIANGSTGLTATSSLSLKGVIATVASTLSNNNTSTGTPTLNAGTTLNAGIIDIAYMNYTARR